MFKKKLLAMVMALGMAGAMGSLRWLQRFDEHDGGSGRKQRYRDHSGCGCSSG